MDIQLNPGIMYHIPREFPVPNDEYYDNETVDCDGTELGQFVIDDSGVVYVVLDKFDTHDGYGCVVMTGNEQGDLEFWSTNADFYLVQ